MVEADQPLSRAFVVTALALEVIETIALQGRSDDRQHSSLNPDLLNADVVWLEHIVIKTLLGEPLTHGADRGGNDRRTVVSLLGFGYRRFAHDSTGSAAGVRTAASVARVWPVGAAARAAFCVSARR